MKGLLRARSIKPCKRMENLRPSSLLLLMIHYVYVTAMRETQMKTVLMSIGRTEADVAPVETMIATRSIVEVTERKNETGIAIVIETIDVVEQVVEKAVLNQDHDLILHRRRMAGVVVLMDVPTVVQLLKVAEIITTARVQVATQTITVTATETLIRGIIVITVIIGTETVTAIVMAEGVAMVAPQLHLVISATEVVVVEDDTMTVDLVAQAPATDRLIM